MSPRTINGYPIVRSFPTPSGAGTRAGHVILVDRCEGYQRYVTAWAGDGDNEWVWGHYFDEIKKAIADYTARCERRY